MAKAKEYWNTPIEDNQTSYGGKAHIGETLGEFLEEVGHDMDTDMEMANIALTECGCEPILYKGMKNCRFVVRFPEDNGLDIGTGGDDLYFSNPHNALASADRLKEYFGLETIEVEDLVTGVRIETVNFTEA